MWPNCWPSTSCRPGEGPRSLLFLFGFRLVRFRKVVVAPRVGLGPRNYPSDVRIDTIGFTRILTAPGAGFRTSGRLFLLFFGARALSFALSSRQRIPSRHARSLYFGSSFGPKRRKRVHSHGSHRRDKCGQAGNGQDRRNRAHKRQWIRRLNLKQ